MLAAVGHPVTRLHRSRYAGLTLEGSSPGAWRELGSHEVERLRETAREAATRACCSRCAARRWRRARCAAHRAHGGSTLTGYVSTFSALDPPVLGVIVNVLGGDDRLRLSNYSGKTVVILGYEGEPFLRFAEAGVFENTALAGGVPEPLSRPACRRRRLRTRARRRAGGRWRPARPTRGTTTASTGRRPSRRAAVEEQPDRDRT